MSGPSDLELGNSRVDLWGYADRVLGLARPTPVRGRCKVEALLHASIGCAEEGAEALGVVKKVAFYGEPLDQTKLLEEAGDLLFYFTYLLREAGFSFEEVASANIRKLEARYGGSFSVEKSLNRNAGAERAAMENRAAEGAE